MLEPIIMQQSDNPPESCGHFGVMTGGSSSPESLPGPRGTVDLLGTVSAWIPSMKGHGPRATGLGYHEQGVGFRIATSRLDGCGMNASAHGFTVGLPRFTKPKTVDRLLKASVSGG